VTEPERGIHSVNADRGVATTKVRGGALCDRNSTQDPGERGTGGEGSGVLSPAAAGGSVTNRAATFYRATRAERSEANAERVPQKISILSG